MKMEENGCFTVEKGYKEVMHRKDKKSIHFQCYLGTLGLTGACNQWRSSHNASFRAQRVGNYKWLSCAILVVCCFVCNGHDSVGRMQVEERERHNTTYFT